ncbi:hypothetical protein ACFV80_43280 [Streptomyces sp. NPDC059862]|uniref:hypothetical protein n=1 Tax=Streptomyces sp. NPDC059862 TaxID=3346975 RepID=UPI0036513E50
MTTSLPRSPRLLLITTVILAAAGVVLLVLPHGMPTRTPASPPPEGVASASLSPAAPPTPEAAHEDTTPAGVSELPPHGEGAAGDPTIQKALEAAWPADLPAGDERQLLTAGRDLLRADATGIGRTKWPGVFPDPGAGLAPAFATARFRIQAAIARRDGAADRAVVHLVWAGADRGGTFTDGRITDWHFTRTTSKGVSTWTPQPRT